MHFPVPGFRVPEWAAAGTNGPPVHEPRAEWERTVDPARPHLASSLLAPSSSSCVSLLVQSQKTSGYLDGPSLCCPQQLLETFLGEGDREERLSPRVPLAITAT